MPLTEPVSYARAHNFGAGPATMPIDVLSILQQELLDYKGLGLSVLEMSHRSEAFAEIIHHTEQSLRDLLNIPSDYAVLFMQGGASAQFALTVQNLDRCGKVSFANTGYWSRKAMSTAAMLTEVTTAVTVDSSPLKYVPSAGSWHVDKNSSYLHVTDNETIDGIALADLPDTEVSVVCDMSSSILSRPIDVKKYQLIYAGAQKNIGPAGLTVIILHKSLIETSRTRQLPPVFNYAAMYDACSLLNTPPTFIVYAAGLVFDWLLTRGGLTAMHEQNKRQANRLYEVLDAEECYINAVHPENRSIMNIPFQLSDPEKTTAFLKGATDRQLLGLKGHKSIGGLRVSLYNAVSDESVDALLDYLSQFARNCA